MTKKNIVWYQNRTRVEKTVMVRHASIIKMVIHTCKIKRVCTFFCGRIDVNPVLFRYHHHVIRINLKKLTVH